VDVRDGLIGSLELVHEDHMWVQKFDYQKIPFQCFSCHKIGHVQAQCRKIVPLFQKNRKVWVKFISEAREHNQNQNERSDPVRVEENPIIESLEDGAGLVPPSTKLPLPTSFRYVQVPLFSTSVLSGDP